MRKLRVLIVVAVVGLALAGCSEDALRELGLDDDAIEDMQEFEDFAQDALDAAQEAAENPPSGNDGPDSNDPNWSPGDLPPPPGTPSRSEDQSDEGFCPSGRTCGWASYDGDDGSAAREHYEDIIGPPTSERRQPAVDDNGEPYEVVTTTYDNGDETVTVYTDHHGTDVNVQSDPTP